MPAVLVMSATITPPEGVGELARRDPGVRLADYCSALAFYLSTPSECIDRVVFVENSNSDVTPMEEVSASVPHDKQVEIISFNGNDHPWEYGRAYGEMKLLDYGLTHSKLISRDDVLWKVTARLRVLNIAKLVASSPSGYDFYCDLRDAPIIGHRLGRNKWMELRIFSCTVDAYHTLFFDLYRDLRVGTMGDDVKSPEEYLFRQLMGEREKGSLDIVPRFRVQPYFAGYGGHLNVNYETGSYRVKHCVRQLARRIAPELWL